MKEVQQQHVWKCGKSSTIKTHRMYGLKTLLVEFGALNVFHWFHGSSVLGSIPSTTYTHRHKVLCLVNAVFMAVLLCK